jgi:hypothetical protein
MTSSTDINDSTIAVVTEDKEDVIYEELRNPSTLEPMIDSFKIISKVGKLIFM